jgi:hypothetical protein
VYVVRVLCELCIPELSALVNTTYLSFGCAFA